MKKLHRLTYFGLLPYQQRTHFLYALPSRALSSGVSIWMALTPCVFGFVTEAVADTPKASQVRPARPPIDESYVLGPGDTLSVTVLGYPNLGQEGIIIPPDGTVTLPGIGTVKLAGKTRLRVQTEFKTALIRSSRMRNPSVAVSIKSLRSGIAGSVVLSGDVPRAGIFDIREGQRLSDLLANVGLQERLEERQATLIRNGSASPLNLKAASLSPRSKIDIALRTGDRITVRKIIPKRITVVGDVLRPGEYELHLYPQKPAMELNLSPKLSDLLTTAGLVSANATLFNNSQMGTGTTGMGNNTANTEGQPTSRTLNSLDISVKTDYSAYLQRGTQKIILDPEAALSQIDGPANIKLMGGDFVTVDIVPPIQPITVYLDGLATQTGSFQVKPKSTVLELLTGVGGPTKAPDQIIASVRRGNRIIPLDLTKLLLSTDSDANIELQNGDIVQLREPEAIDVRVAGSVVKPGLLRLKPGSTIFDAILEAGNLSVPREEARLNVLRKDDDGKQRILNANVADIVGLVDPSTNAVLHQGDLINVSQIQRPTVFINGQVNSPGPFQLKEGEGLAELVTRAGGAKDDAILSSINIERKGQVLRVDAYDSIKNGTPLDFDLKDGDFVNVAQNNNRVYVMEAVSKAGYYAIPERGRLTLLDALAQAMPQPQTKVVYLTRAQADGTIDSKVKPRTIKLQDLRTGKEPNITLQPRDIVFVESPKPKRSFVDTLSSLSVFRLFLPF